MLSNPIFLEALRSVVLPSAVATVTALLWWRPWSKRAAARTLWPLALAMGGALVWSTVATHGWSGFWPADVTARLPIVVGLGVLAGLWGVWHSSRPVLRWTGTAALTALAVYAITRHRRDGAWDTYEGMLWIAALGSLWLLMLLPHTGRCAREAATNSPDRTVSIPEWAGLIALVLPWPGVLYLAGMASFSQSASVPMGVVAVIGGLAVWSCGLRTLPRSGAAAVVVFWTGSLALLGYTLGPDPVPRGAYALALLASQAGWLTRLPMKNWARTAAVLAAGGLIAGAATGVAAWEIGLEAPDEPDPLDSLYGEVPDSRPPTLGADASAWIAPAQLTWAGVAHAS